VTDDMSTLSHSSMIVEQGYEVAPVLTIAYHPDVARIGERATLDAVVEVSRSAPLFTPVAGGTPRPLLDRYLSRSALVTLRRSGDRVVIEPTGNAKVTLDGAPANHESVFDRAALARGVTLELANRCVLVVHQSRTTRPRAPRYDLVGDSDAIEAVRANLARVADLPVPVLVRGETGTGKELVARALHAYGPRRDRPFVGVNLAALPPSTAASELFGHVRGAFTGATADRDGLFARAQGGVLFLDEIGEAPSEVQPMLLRVLETGELAPLGTTRTRQVDVRLIAATDADLEVQIAEGGFREALFHRLAGFQLLVPPLRERRDDIGRLLVHFLRAELAATGDSGRLEAQAERSRLWLPAAIVARFVRHAWPGNVRQLRNAVRQLAIASRGAEVASLDAALERTLAEAQGRIDSTRPSQPRRDPATLGDDEVIDALRASSWRAGPAASRLGISRSTLYVLIDRSSRIRKAKDIPDAELRRALDDHGGDLDQVASALEISRRALQLRIAELGWS
jgi:two-component system nitrogen regulation response regulator GlnG